MNKKQALNILNALWRYRDCGYSDKEVRDALDYAIRAVEVYRNCGNCVHNTVHGRLRGCDVWICDYEPKVDINAGG